MHSQLTNRRGFGLLESLICLSLISLMFLGALTLILSAGRGTVRTQSQVYASADAANSIQSVIGQLREASAFALPTSDANGTAETAWAPVAGTALNQFSTSLNGETVNTAIQIITPPTLNPADNGYTDPSATTLRVLSTTGTVRTTTPYNVASAGGLAVPSSRVLLIYRGDPDGTPDADPTGSANPKAGTYLWQYQLQNGIPFDPVQFPPRALCKSVSTAPNAVQFVRPYYAANPTPEQTQMEIKIISSYYSPINGRQTSEQGDGTSSSQLSGKCVFMRDHYAGSLPAPAHQGSRAGNNVFQRN